MTPLSSDISPIKKVLRKLTEPDRSPYKMSPRSMGLFSSDAKTTHWFVSFVRPADTITPQKAYWGASWGQKQRHQLQVSEKVGRGQQRLTSVAGCRPQQAQFLELLLAALIFLLNPFFNIFITLTLILNYARSRQAEREIVWKSKEPSKSLKYTEYFKFYVLLLFSWMFARDHSITW